MTTEAPHGNRAPRIDGGVQATGARRRVVRAMVAALLLIGLAAPGFADDNTGDQGHRGIGVPDVAIPLGVDILNGLINQGTPPNPPPTAPGQYPPRYPPQYPPATPPPAE